MKTHTDMTLFLEAKQFIDTCYEELNIPKSEQKKRIDEIQEEIDRTGTYTHTSFELEHGAKMAWRNSNRCIGRLLWNTLHVFDEREVETEEEAYEKLLEHIRFATNDGKIRSTITVFAPQQRKQHLRIWNHQLIRYAGYKEGDRLIGDSASVAFTTICQELGWNGKKTPYDILPLVIQKGNERPKVFDIPEEIVKEVPIKHPHIDGFEQFHMKWYAVPIISDMRLEIGGIHYGMAPFNGWYMGTEIGARNLADSDRYNFLPKIAERMNLDTSSNRTLWKDKALVELNIAILDSYQKAEVTLVDHHTAAKQFKSFEEQEKRNGRNITGNWTWLIPPVSPATTHIYHRPYKNDIVKPNYFYQDPPW